MKNEPGILRPAIATKKRNVLGENDQWAVFSDDTETRTFILTLIPNQQEWKTEEISTRGRKVPVTFVSFEVIQKITSKNDDNPKRVLFRRAIRISPDGKKQYGAWKISKEGRTSFHDYCREAFHSWKRNWQR